MYVVIGIALGVDNSTAGLDILGNVYVTLNIQNTLYIHNRVSHILSRQVEHRGRQVH